MVHSYQTTPDALRLLEEETLPRAFSILRPPPRLTVSQWADRERQLSPESSAEPGQWYTSRAEYLREIMDCILRPEVEEVTVMKAAQTGVTEALLNIAAYYICEDPSPILDVEPDEKMARDFSVRRLEPMIRDTKPLAARIIHPENKRDNMFEKMYPGGILTISWATSVAQLASRPIRIMLANDLDRFKPSIGLEGDPYELARKRTQTFWNRKIFTNSTPTTKHLSKIEELFMLSNQQHFLVACPHCKAKQKLIFGPQSQFADIAKGMLVYKVEDGKVKDVHYQCGNCSKPIPETAKYRMIREGEWKARHPERVKHQGFHINELYSPWSSWTEIAESFVKKKYRVETLRTWINTVAGETFDESGMTTLTGNRLLDARERYTKIPEGVIFLTAAVDVQDDRLECYIEGWGLEEENWLIDHYVAEGSPAKKSTWLLMETFLLEKRWEHENGFTAGYGQIGGLMGVGVDTGGHATKEAYAFVKRHNKKRFFALKGKGGPGIPIVYESKSKKLPVRLTIVGVDDAKQRIYDRLQQEKKGPGYQHFNHRVDKDYFDQLLSEHKVIRTVGGLKVQRWELIDPKRRNEALDCKVYNMAVYHKLNIDVESFSRILRERMEQAGKIKAEFDSQSRTNPQQGIKPTSRRKRLIVRSSLMNKLRRR